MSYCCTIPKPFHVPTGLSYSEKCLLTFFSHFWYVFFFKYLLKYTIWPKCVLCFFFLKILLALKNYFIHIFFSTLIVTTEFMCLEHTYLAGVIKRITNIYSFVFTTSVFLCVSHLEVLFGFELRNCRAAPYSLFLLWLCMATSLGNLCAFLLHL